MEGGVHEEGVAGGDAGGCGTEARPAAGAGAAVGARVCGNARGATGESALRMHDEDNPALARALEGGWGSRPDPPVPARRPRRISATLIDLIRHARVDFSYGSTRTQLWLWRVHRLRVAQGTIQSVVLELGLPKVKPVRKRRPRQLKLFERDRPGDCVQVDVKFVKVGGQRMFQYTALDDCTRYRVLRLYRRVNHWNSIAFFRELRAACPFPIRRPQTDNGNEFALAFKLTVEAAGIEHRYIRPRRPQQKGYASYCTFSVASVVS